MIATGLPLVMVCSGGRDSQSNTFFNTPGIEKLYSGVTTSSASARLNCSRNATTGCGNP